MRLGEPAASGRVSPNRLGRSSSSASKLTYRDLAMAIRSEVTMLKRAASARCLTPPVTRGVGADPDFVDVSTWRWKARFCVHRTRLRSVPIESRQHQGKGFFVSNTNGIGQRRSRLSRLSLGGGCERAAAARGNSPVLENLYGRGWKSVTRTADCGSSSVLFSYQRTMIQCLRHGSMSSLHFSLDSGAGHARDRAILFGIPSKYSTI
jgi:hypothetical protein